MPSRLIRLILLPALLLGAAGLEAVWRDLPAPRDADAPPEVFASERAFAHIRQFARTPHPAGTEANRRTRAYLVARLAELGLAPETRPATVIRQASFGGRDVVLAGHVTNVLARIDGAAPDAGTVVLMAHYDSRPMAPGAADDGAGTASLLETARALAAGPAPRNAIVFLFTDGEEAGLLGARAFFDNHPWAAQADVVLNFEARGSSGAAKMFQTGLPNAAVIGLYKRAVDRPHANALMGGVYRVMPNDTDFTPALEAGKTGLNFAFIDGPFDYHSMTDHPDNLSAAALQHLGDQALAMARTLGDTALPLDQTGSRVYFDILGRGLVDYPLWLGWALAALAIAAWAGLIIRLRRNDHLPWGELGRGFTASVAALLGIGLLLDALSGLLTIDMPGPVASWARKAALDLHLAVFTLAALAALLYAVRALQTGISRRHWARILIGLGALTLIGGLLPALDGPAGPPIAVVAGGHLGRLVLVALLGLLVLHRPVGQWGLWAGGLTFLALLGAILQIPLPEAGFTAILPLLFGLAAAHWTLARDGRILAPSNLLATGLLAFPGLVWAVHLGALLYLGLAYSLPGLLVIPLIIGAIPALPVLASLAAPLDRAAPAGMAAATAALAIWALATSPFDARHPRPTELAYLVDTRSGDAVWATSLEHGDPWLEAVMNRGTAIEVLAGFAPFLSGPYRGVPAPAAPVAPPDIDLTAGSPDQPHRLVIRPGDGAEHFYLFLKSDSPVVAANLNGRELEPPGVPGGWWSILIPALPDGPVTVSLRLEDQAASVRGRYVQIRAGYPDGAAADIPARPAHLMPLPYSRAGQTVVIGQFPESE